MAEDLTTPSLKLKRGIKAYTEDGNVAAEIYSLNRRGDRIIIDGKALGVMRMDMVLTLAEVLRGFKLLLCWAIISFVLLIPYFGMKRLLGRLGQH